MRCSPASAPEASPSLVDLSLLLPSLKVRPAGRAWNADTDTDVADLIQDLYLKELKSYKPPPQKGPDEGAVQKFSPPAAPKSPEETNLASEMQEYENQKVEVEGQAAAGETQQSSEEDYFEDLKQFDEEEAHH